MILSGAISTPTTSADMKPLIEIGAREKSPAIPLRSVRGQLGPLSVEDIVESSSQLTRSKVDEQTPKAVTENPVVVDSYFTQAILWKNVVFLWFCTIILALFKPQKGTK